MHLSVWAKNLDKAGPMITDLKKRSICPQIYALVSVSTGRMWLILCSRSPGRRLKPPCVPWGCCPSVLCPGGSIPPDGHGCKAKTSWSVFRRLFWEKNRTHPNFPKAIVIFRPISDVSRAASSLMWAISSLSKFLLKFDSSFTSYFWTRPDRIWAFG